MNAMTRDDIIRMARQADLHKRVKDGAGYVVRIPNLEKLERFAALVAQREEYACALACQSVVVYYEKQGNSKAVDVAWQCNDAIQWRGEDPTEEQIMAARLKHADKISQAIMHEICEWFWFEDVQ